MSISDRFMFHYRDQRELLNVLRKQKDQMKMDLKKYFSDIQGANTLAWDNQEGRIEGETLETVGTKLSKAQMCEKMVWLTSTGSLHYLPIIN